jgi:TatD DNase family protein
MSLVDSHCHLNFEPMGDDIPDVLARAKAANVDYMLCVSVNLEDYPEVLAIAQAHKNIFASVGVHPCYQDVKEPTVEELLSLARDENVVAIGETGLDYFRVEGDMAWQQSRFVRHIEVGIAVDKPLIIHTREAAEDTMRILREHHADRCGAVMHCFAEDWETAKKALDLGFYISFSGIVTFNSAARLKEVAKQVPLDRILVETDAPYLAPVPMRGRPNQPAFVAHTAQYVADLKGLSLETLSQQTSDNFFELFGSAVK